MQVFQRGIVVNCSLAVCFRTKPAESMNGNVLCNAAGHYVIGGGHFSLGFLSVGRKIAPPALSLYLA